MDALSTQPAQPSTVPRSLCMACAIFVAIGCFLHTLHTDDANLYQFSNPNNLLNHFASIRFSMVARAVIMPNNNNLNSNTASEQAKEGRKKIELCRFARTSSTPAKIRNFSFCRPDKTRVCSSVFIKSNAYVCRHCVIATNVLGPKTRRKFNRISISIAGAVPAGASVWHQQTVLVNSRRVRLCTIK